MAKESKSQKEARLKKEKAAKEAAEQKKKQDGDVKMEDTEKPKLDLNGNPVFDAVEGFTEGVAGQTFQQEPNPYKDVDLLEWEDEPDLDCYKNCQEKEDVKNVNCKMLKDAFVADMKARGCKVVVTQKSTKKTCKSSKSGKKSKTKYPLPVYQYSPPPVMSNSCGCRM